ncbi:uncharacterized protein LOC126673545 isoform X2 [Mercurialis annua]|uniref:uncharacterized protein LOC126673545 isoform X2 n=1 Tax=Mercurialis annua TaxID=3986 RepID=UPI00215FDB72|nr:uncharacterized protein LOC126673545 isoform X2 [Mercurialis annua]
MDQQWRPSLTYPPLPPSPPSSQFKICPICSISHFPFCPPPPPPPSLLPTPPPYPAYNQNPRFPPPPPVAPPHPDYPPPDPYYNGMNSYGNYNSNGEVDRRYKRARVDESNQNSIITLDNERRLKLIRDHGGSANFNFGYSPDSGVNFSNNRYSNTADMSNHQIDYSNQTREAGHVDFYNPNQNHMFNNMISNQYQNQQQQNYVRHDYSNMTDPSRGSYPPSENRVLLGGYQHQHAPPLPPPSPPPPIPMEPPFQPSPPPPPPSQTSLFPVHANSSVTNPYLPNKPSTSFFSEEWQTSSMPKQPSPDKPIVIDAFRLFKPPFWSTRRDHIVIILRGLPGSGKSYLAKMIRDLEVENGGYPPRIHSMDDYFMTEVEKVEENDASKSSGFVRGKKPTVKKVMEYCYEPEMEEAYRDNMLKAFKKTLEEGTFTLVIVDDRNLRVADFAQFWAIAKRSGYEVYISEPTYKDPAGCAARNIHGFTLDEIKSMAEQWEEAPTLYLQLDIKSLFHGDDLKESGIQEIDMDTEDGTSDDNPSGQLERNAEKTRMPSLEDDAPQGEKRWNAEEDHPREGVILKSKWSEDLDEDDTEGSEGVKGNLNALSGLIQAYGKQGKSVCWSDQAGNTGFSIGAAKKAKKSLVIGPGAGYNLRSNPLPEEGTPASSLGKGESRRQTVFQEQLRAERESFKAVFDKRRRRIGGLALEEE